MPDPHPTVETPTSAQPFEKHLTELQEIRRQLPPEAPAHIRRRLNLAIQVASSPTCPESQADGVPCASATTACDQCAKALEFIETVRAEVDASLRGESDPETDSREI